MKTASPLQPFSMGCTVHANRHGKLTFRVYVAGREYWEGIGIDDTPANRRLAEAQATLIADEIERGVFDYLKWFPRGNKAYLFCAETETKTLRQYYDHWIKNYEPPLSKRTRWKNYSSHFKNYFLDSHGDRLMESITAADIRALRNELIKGKGLKPKTAKNAINATLRAFFRDAVSDRILERTPFDELPAKFWPADTRPEPDPFLEHERDEIIAYMNEKYRRSWPAGAAFCFSQFWTGMRPSEMTPRTWRDLDPRTANLSITTSRTRGEEGETKTSGSHRVIQLFPQVLERLLELKPLRAQPDDLILTDQRGLAINQYSYGDHFFQGALTALKIRHRDFYCTRHTFISVMLSHGENLLQTAEYVGSSPQMLSTRYGKWNRGAGRFGQAAIAAASENNKEKKATNP